MRSLFASEKTVTVDGERYKIVADQTIEGSSYFEVEHLESGETEKIGRKKSTAENEPYPFAKSDKFDSIEVLRQVDEVEVHEE